MKTLQHEEPELPLHHLHDVYSDRSANVYCEVDVPSEKSARDGSAYL